MSSEGANGDPRTGAFSAEQLAQLQDRLRTVEAREQLLANVSHEIRTPLNGVLGILDLLRETDLNDEQRELLEAAKTSGEALMFVVNDFLDFSKINAGKLSLVDEPTDFHAWFHALARSMEPLARARSLEVVWNLEADVPQFLSGDLMRLRQIVINLTSNAFKFTPREGGVVIIARVKAREENTVTVEICINDTGAGISDDYRERLFRAFEQGDPLTSHKHGGTGLGLSISKSLVEMMHGRIYFNSRERIGSSFRLEIPLRLCERPVSVPDPSPGDGRRKTDSHLGLRVLVAEDNPVNQSLAKRLLERCGCAVEIVENGELAVQAFFATETPGYDVVLMDCHMPVLDGLEATVQIRQNESVWESRLPIIALTADVSPGHRERCLAAGMDGYITKPFTFDELRTVLRRIAEQKRRPRVKRP